MPESQSTEAQQSCSLVRMWPTKGRKSSPPPAGGGVSGEAPETKSTERVQTPRDAGEAQGSATKDQDMVASQEREE